MLVRWRIGLVRFLHGKARKTARLQCILAQRAAGWCSFLRAALFSICLACPARLVCLARE